ncbi:MAG TPA: nitrous oxide reductase family maturation protein NosD [Anaerolineae bacterium]|nr:nitrous oxide reductase family maturation protein NosD [Anaerolineae bacterium]
MKWPPVFLAIVAALLTSGVAGAQLATEAQRRGEWHIHRFSVNAVSPWLNPNRLVVSPDGPYTTIQAALADARDGDTIEVQPGTYAGPLVVDKSLTLEGMGWPIVDGGGQGTVVELTAPDVVFRGFEVRGSGVEPDRNHAGITLSAPRIVVENNRLRDVLFGIFVAQADDSIVRGNDVTSKEEYDVGRKGDAIRLWYSRGVTVEGNHVYDARDVVMWYSAGAVMRDNLIEDSRYGVHLMYCDNALIERNRVLNNSVGIYVMYSDQVMIRQNAVHGQRGPSGYALGFKDADQVVVTGNVAVDNRAAVFLDGTPFRPDGLAHFEENIFAFNDVGVALQPAVRGAAIEGNTFWENVEQVAVQGGGALGQNSWSGNFWSDYAGFDADGDGRGDTPYRSERFFEGIADREPRLRMLLYSPAVQAIEFAATAFPLVRPQPKLTDPAPLAEPVALPAGMGSAEAAAVSMPIAALALLGLGALCGLLVRARGNRRVRARTAATVGEGIVKMSVHIDRVTKQYGKVKALDGVSCEVRSGEAVALWGANGAGKTTLLKAVIGLIDFQGEILIGGHDVRRAGKRARRSIGYVPQETVFYDWSVQATMEFYARLKKVDPGRIAPLLDRLGLVEHATKQVSALSGGLKQRLALAIALLADPPVLLLDEPTANLDAQARADYLRQLSTLRKEGRTVIFASHRLEEIDALADRVLVLEGGRLVESLDPESLKTQHLQDVEMTLWVPEAQRAAALACFARQGLATHFNGRGTLVVRVGANQKMRPLRLLEELHISVTDFEIERSQSWN